MEVKVFQIEKLSATKYGQNQFDFNFNNYTVHPIISLLTCKYIYSLIHSFGKQKHTSHSGVFKKCCESMSDDILLCLF